MLRQIIKRRAKKVGLSPGTLVHIGERKVEEVKITLTEYDQTSYEQSEVPSIEQCPPPEEQRPGVTWINVDGLHQVDVVETLGQCWGFHPLVLEDILNTDQRPKMEDYGDYIFVVLKMLSYDPDSSALSAEQISLLLGPNYVLSFREQSGDTFRPIRERLTNERGRIRKSGADYLAYALLDTIVDHYFVILERIGDRVEDLDEQLAGAPAPETMKTIHELKRETIVLRKSVWPLRELISALERGETPLIQDSTGIYLRDVYDHTIQVIEVIESFRDTLSGMLDIYLSSVSNRMNEVMQVLTIIATIFIPLTFIAGVYGMNFQYMPELGWRWAYPLVWLIMLVVAGLMVVYFRRKKWLP